MRRWPDVVDQELAVAGDPGALAADGGVRRRGQVRLMGVGVVTLSVACLPQLQPSVDSGPAATMGLSDLPTKIWASKPQQNSPSPTLTDR